MTRVVKGNPARGNPEWPRVLQVGYGAFGPAHARAWTKIGHGCRLVVADPSPAARAAALREFRGLRAIDDYRAALAECDLVDIVTPSDTHAAIALDAMQAGCDVFIEKPMTTTLADAERVARSAQAAGRMVQVGYFFRSHPMAIDLRARLCAGEFGRIVWIDADFTSLKRPRRDAGVVLNDAVHFLDLVCWLMQGKPSEVTALLRSPLGRELEDIALIALAWPGGAAARVQASCVLAGEHADPVVPGGWSRKRVVATGEAGQIAVDFMTHLRVRRDCRLEPRDGWWAPRVSDAQEERVEPVDADAVIAAELASFVANARAGAMPDAGVESGVAMAALCEAIAASARERRSVAL